MQTCYWKNITEIMQTLETAYAPEAACEWDNVGLLAGQGDRTVSKIYIALDASDEVIDAAIDRGAEMLITHHPLIFNPLRRVTDEDFIGRRVVKLLQHRISYYVIHTNYDVRRMAELSAAMMGLQEPEILEVTSCNGNVSEGLGRIGSLAREMSLKDCCRLVKQKFSLTAVGVYGDLHQKLQRIAISPGSGKSMVDAALSKGAQVLITGDIDHHTGLDALARGLSIIDAGHYGLEHIFIEDMHTFLKREYKELIIDTAPIRHPLQIV